MSTEPKSDTDQQQFLQMALEAWQSSGLSVRQFCGQEGLSESSFYSWQKRLTPPDKPKADPPSDCQADPFIRISMPSEKSVGLELVLSSGHTLRILVGIDRQTLMDGIGCRLLSDRSSDQQH